MLKFIAVVLCGLLPAAGVAADLSRYRSFQLGTTLATVAKQARVDPSEAKAIHRRPALIEELEWRPRPLGSTSETEPAKEMVFTFLDGALFRIAVHYDRYETEGLTGEDLVEVISATYGAATKPAPPAPKPPESHGNQEELLAEWQDAEYRFELFRFSYGNAFKLIGVLKKLEAPARAAIAEAGRLDDQEAPQREAARITRDAETERVKLEKARAVNKAKFRP